MHLQIAREAVDQHLQIAGELIEGDGGLSEKAKLAVGAGKFYAKWFPNLTHGEGQNPRSYDEFGTLAQHLRFVERNSRKLARVTFYAMGRYGAKLEQKGNVLGRIVDIGAELFSIAAAVTYAEAQKKQHPERAREIDELAGLFCLQARRRAKDLFHALRTNEDDENFELAQKVLTGRYSFIEEGIPYGNEDEALFGEEYRQPTAEAKKNAAVDAEKSITA
jgi:hypothetical protein